jgi:hypothetical protein
MTILAWIMTILTGIMTMTSGNVSCHSQVKHMVTILRLLVVHFFHHFVDISASHSSVQFVTRKKTILLWWVNRDQR